jgi:hypothetical protein
MPIRKFTSEASSPISVNGITNAGTYVITPSALTLDSPATTSNYTSVVYSPATLIVNKATQTKVGLVQNYTASRGSAVTLIQLGGSGTGSRTETLTASSLAAGCSLSGLTLTVNPTTITSCDVITSKALDTNYLADSATVTVYLLEFVLSIPLGNVGGGGEIGLNGATIWSELNTLPVVTSYTTHAKVGDTISITGSDLQEYDVTFTASSGTVTSPIVDFPPYRCMGEMCPPPGTFIGYTGTIHVVVPSGAITGPMVIRNRNGIKRVNFTVDPA